MSESDHELIGHLRELHLLLSFERALPDRRPMSSDLLLQQRLTHAEVVNQAISRILNKEAA